MHQGTSYSRDAAHTAGEVQRQRRLSQTRHQEKAQWQLERYRQRFWLGGSSPPLLTLVTRRSAKTLYLVLLLILLDDFRFFSLSVKDFPHMYDVYVVLFVPFFLLYFPARARGPSAASVFSSPPFALSLVKAVN